MVMGLIGTRSLTTEIPGIEQLVDRGELLIKDGIKAYDALQTIRGVAPGSPVPQEAKDMFESKGQSMGYALLLKRYVDDPRQATPEQIRKAALDTVPPVAPLFWSFRVMVGLGMFFILLTGTFFILSTRRTLDKHRWLLKLAVFAIPLPWVAIEAGWIVAEVGRQPWVIEGVLPTAVAVSNLGASTLLITIAGFAAIYTVLLIIEMKLMLKAIRKGPEEKAPAPCQPPLPFRLNAPKEGQTMILHEMISYETLRLIWWLLIGILLVGFAITDGFDLGTGILLPFVGKTDLERRVVINSIGPVWEGNQVWLILGGGAIFAAWPQLYAVSFSGFYLAMFVILVALIVRPVAFKFRSKREDPRWRARWDAALFVGGFVPALICGVAIGNVLQGVPFRFSPDMHIFYDGSFFALLNPFALLCGLVSVAMLVMHGATWLQLKTDGAVAERARRYGSVAAIATVVLYALAGVALWLWVDGYRISSTVVVDGPSNPMLKTAEVHVGAWFLNFAAHPWTWIAPALGLLCPLLAFAFQRARREVPALLASAAGIAGIILGVGAAMFPFILPSSIDPRASLTVWDSSSSHMTLFIMLVVTAVFIPLIVAYTTWVYKVLWGKVDEKAIKDDSGHAY